MEPPALLYRPAGQQGQHQASLACSRRQLWRCSCSHSGMGLLRALRVPLTWREVLTRTVQAILTDVLGWAAELAYYFFLALFPALLFLVALASFFPIHNLTDQIVDTLASVAPAEVLRLVRDQLWQISKNNNRRPLSPVTFVTHRTP